MQVKTFGLFVLSCLVVGVWSDSSCDNSSFAHYIIDQIDQTIRLENAKLDPNGIRLLESTGAYSDFELNEYTNGFNHSASSKRSANSAWILGIYLKGFSRISLYSCSKSNDTNVAIVKLEIGDGSLGIDTKFTLSRLVSEQSSISHLNTKISNMIANVHFRLNESKFTVKEIHVENFEFRELNHWLEAGIGSDRRNEYQILEIFYIKTLLDTKVRHHIESEFLPKLIQAALDPIRFDPERDDKVDTFLTIFFSTDLPKALARLELLGKYISHTIKEPDQIWGILHERIVGFDSLWNGCTYETNLGKWNYTGHWTVGYPTSGLELQLQLDIKTDKLPKPVEGIPLTTELDPLHISFELQDNGNQLTLTSLSVAKLKNRVDFTPTSADSNVKQEVEKYVLPPGGPLPKEFEEMFESIRALLEAKIREFVVKKLAEFHD